jgi:cation diffusion facilitator CzcD-associated flavoprotein CzcO
MENIYDVIVIGAGAAGLTAAYELNENKPECKLIVLEARGGQIDYIEVRSARDVEYSQFCTNSPSEFTQDS